MNKTTLDALLIDRALGALPPETEALLDAYLEQSPAIAAALDKTCDAVNLARAAFDHETAPALPSFHAPVLARRRKLHRRSLQVIGLAATLAIGFFFGQYHLGRPPASVPDSRRAVIESVPAPKAAGIWSITPERLTRTKKRSSNWKWHSPVQQPRLTTQEMNHEI